MPVGISACSTERALLTSITDGFRESMAHSLHSSSSQRCLVWLRSVEATLSCSIPTLANHVIGRREMLRRDLGSINSFVFYSIQRHLCASNFVAVVWGKLFNMQVHLKKLEYHRKVDSFK